MPQIDSRRKVTRHLNASSDFVLSNIAIGKLNHTDIRNVNATEVATNDIEIIHRQISAGGAKAPIPPDPLGAWNDAPRIAGSL